MENDPLESMLRQADPHHGDEPSQVDQCRSQWTRLADRRRQVRRRIRSACKVAGGLAIASFVSLALLLRSETGSDDHQAALLQRSVDNVGPLDKEQFSVTATPLDSKRDDEPIPQPPRSGIRAASNHALPTDPVRPNARTTFSFERYVDHAGVPGSLSWKNAARKLAASHPQVQRIAIRAVEHISNVDQRQRAMDLVVAAAGTDARSLLIRWLDNSTVRPIAWQRLYDSATPDERLQMVELAQSDSERLQICNAIVNHPDPLAVRQLVTLAEDRSWHAALSASTKGIRPEHLQGLIEIIRSDNRELRTGAVFVIATTPNQQIDQQLAGLVLQGRHQQAAYIALLSRKTPQAQTFLSHAAAQPHLAASLYSAHAHFVNIKPRLHFWLTQLQGDHDEPANTSERQDSMVHDIRLVRNADVSGGTS
ncbi:hypothetical protein U8335_21795 [Roseiconus lacunae]|uniref:hypothetical protein n=1 Tax=Roseiconus lacunae TaxID=2605694 RepID=UPI00308A4C7E|nr:hypothetical protein U8335_21795 [Stieleria sp. HD01]